MYRNGAHVYDMHAKGEEMEGGGVGGGGGGIKSYHTSDSGQAFSCLNTSGADQGIVPYMLEVFDVQSKCSYEKIPSLQFIQFGKSRHNCRSVITPIN